MLTDINCVMWVVYGYVQESHALIPCNSVGILFSLWYIVMYYSACDSKKRYETMKLLVLAFV